MLRLRRMSWLAVFILASLLQASEPRGIWLDVPFIQQEKNGCGAAALAMLLQYWANSHGATPGVKANPAHIQRALYSKAAHGIYGSDLKSYLLAQKYQTFEFQGSWSDLEEHLRKGRPLIVMLRPSAMAPLHYVIVAGVDYDPEVVLINDPAQRKLLKEDRATFEREWHATRNWTLLALPPQVDH